MHKIVENLSRDLRYYDVKKNQLLRASEVEYSEKITKTDFEACLRNGLSIFRQPGEYYPINNIFPIPERSRWVFNGETIKFHSSIGRFSFNPLTKLKRIDGLAEKYLNLLKGKL